MASVYLRVCGGERAHMHVSLEVWWFNSQGEPLLEGQCTHRSMQILHHLSLHIAHICCTYYLAPLPVSCDILPALLSSPSFSLCLSPSPSFPTICNFHSLFFPPPSTSSVLMKIFLQILHQKKKKRKEHQSLSGPEIIFRTCHDLIWIWIYGNRNVKYLLLGL